jgi:predicted oxidoreductase
VTYIVFDHKLAQRFTAWPHYVSTAPGIAYAYLADYRRNRADIYHEAATVEGLARSMGVSAAALSRTFNDYNGAGRAARPALDAAPFYALGPVKSYVVFTDGGLKVTERLEVTREDGAAIAGLYAAGSTGQGGLLLEGHGHHLGWAFISGRIAGRNAAFEVTK